MSQFKEDLKIQVRNQNENAGTIQPITIFPQFGWGVRRLARAIVFATDGTACSNGFASKATNKTQQKPIEIESSSVYKNWRI